MPNYVAAADACNSDMSIGSLCRPSHMCSHKFFREWQHSSEHRDMSHTADGTGSFSSSLVPAAGRTIWRASMLRICYFMVKWGIK